MNTRTFIKSLLVGAIAPSVFLPKASDSFKWKRTASGIYVVSDVDKFQRLPYYLTKVELEHFPSWNSFEMLYGTNIWKPDMGDTKRAITIRSDFYASGF